MDEDAKVIAALDRLLEVAQEVESLIEELDRSMETHRSMGAAEIDMLLARNGLRDAANAVEGIALGIKHVAEREERILA